MGAVQARRRVRGPAACPRGGQVSRRLSSVNPSSCGGRYESGDDAEDGGEEEAVDPDLCPVDGLPCGGVCPGVVTCSRDALVDDLPW